MTMFHVVQCSAVQYNAVKRCRLSALEYSEVKYSRVDGVGLEWFTRMVLYHGDW